MPGMFKQMGIDPSMMSQMMGSMGSLAVYIVRGVFGV
jgi:hypothetical protein